jgi:hypothetical protein
VAVNVAWRWPCSSGGSSGALDVAVELWSWHCSSGCGRAALDVAVELWSSHLRTAQCRWVAALNGAVEVAVELWR